MVIHYARRGEKVVCELAMEAHPNIQSTLAITDDQNLVLFVRFSKGSGIRNII